MFLRIRYPERSFFNWIVPAVMSVVGLILIFIFPGNVSVVQEGGLFAKIGDILPISGGFFVASLTVILTQNHSVLTAVFLGEDKPHLPDEKEPLTRQRFLALLFGYLAFSSFFLLGLISMAELLANGYKEIVADQFYELSKIALVTFVICWLSQMISLTMIGLHYLSDRLYRSDDRSNFKKPLPPAE